MVMYTTMQSSGLPGGKMRVCHGWQPVRRAHGPAQAARTKTVARVTESSAGDEPKGADGIWQPACAAAALAASCLVTASPASANVAELAELVAPAAPVVAPAPLLTAATAAAEVADVSTLLSAPAPSVADLAPSVLAAAAPSLVVSPLPSDATADLTAAVAQQVVHAALSPSPSAGDLAAQSAAAAQDQQPAESALAAAAPSLVMSPLPKEATADLTAAVSQQVVSSALAPSGSAADLSAVEVAATEQPLQQVTRQLDFEQQPEQQLPVMQQLESPALQPQPDPVVEAIQAVVGEGIQGANLVDTSMPAVSNAVPQSWLSTTPLCQLWQAYCTSLVQSPLPTKVATGVVGTFLGDLIAQFAAYFAGRAAAGTARGRQSTGSSQSATPAEFKYDAARCLRLATFSAVIGTPLAHYWFGFLDTAVMPEAPTAPVAVGLKVLLDQVLQTPLGYCLFFSSLKLLEGRPRDAVPEIRSKLLPTLVTNWYVWGPAQLINFTMVPLDLRILYVNVVSIAWTAYISNMANSEAGGESASTNGAAVQAARPRALATAGSQRARAQVQLVGRGGGKRGSTAVL